MIMTMSGQSSDLVTADNLLSINIFQTTIPKSQNLQISVQLIERMWQQTINEIGMADVKQYQSL